MGEGPGEAWAGWVAAGSSGCHLARSRPRHLGEERSCPWGAGLCIWWSLTGPRKVGHPVCKAPTSAGQEAGQLGLASGDPSGPSHPAAWSPTQSGALGAAAQPLLCVQTLCPQLWGADACCSAWVFCVGCPRTMTSLTTGVWSVCRAHLASPHPSQSPSPQSRRAASFQGSGVPLSLGVNALLTEGLTRRTKSHGFLPPARPGAASL